MQTTWSIVVTSALAFAAAGGVAATPAGAAPALQGTSWKLAELAGMELVQGVSSTLELGGDDVLAGSDGCNRYHGRWTVSGSTLTLTPGAATQMACPEPVMKQARAFVASLAATRAYRLDGERLVLLAGPDGERVATLAPLPVATLQGTPWQALMVNDGKGAVASLAKGTAITASFGSDGKLTGSAGCNRYTAAYTTDGDTIAIEQLATTRKVCRGPVMEQERSYLDALTHARTYRLGERSLELRDAGGVLQATFRAAP